MRARLSGQEGTSEMIFGSLFGGADDDHGGLRLAPDSVPDPALDIDPAAQAGESVAVLAGGCFWCVEGVYRQLDGVLEAVSGYTGGTPETANYKAVCTGTTGHAEAVRVRFDPSRLSYGRLLKVFFAIAHDPTTPNRQGNDVGPQYRSAIFTVDEEQAKVARAYIAQLDEANAFVAPIVTEVTPLEAFHEAEAYHQNYAAEHPAQPYIACVALPKIQKLRKYFPDRLRGAATA